jgi:hypothetical protein
MNNNINIILRRMKQIGMMIYLWISQVNIYFIRYNPDKFIDKFGKSKNPYFETRWKF